MALLLSITQGCVPDSTLALELPCGGTQAEGRCEAEALITLDGAPAALSVLGNTLSYCTVDAGGSRLWQAAASGDDSPAERAWSQWTCVDVASDGSSAFWALGAESDPSAGGVERVAPDGSREVLPGIDPGGVALSDDHVWTLAGVPGVDKSCVIRAPKSSLSAGEVSEPSCSPGRAGPIVVGSSGSIAWSVPEHEEVVAMPTFGGEPRVLFNASSSTGEPPAPRTLALARGQVFFALRGALWQVSVTGSGPAEAIEELTPGVEIVAADEHAVWWLDDLEGRLHQYDLESGRSFIAAEGLEQPGAITMDSTHVYVGERGRVSRLRKTRPREPLQ